MEKLCKKCGENKSVLDFNKRSRSQDGLNPECRDCSRKTLAEWKSKNRDKVKAHKASDYQKNADKYKEYHAAYRAKNSERIGYINAAYRLANPEKTKANKAKWYRDNFQRIRLIKSEYRTKNKERQRAWYAEWREQNREYLRQYNRTYQRENKDRRRVHHQNRRARIEASGGKLSVGIASKLKKLQRGKCACCGKPLGSDFHLDHIIPLALGGPHCDSNIQLLRGSCNLKKRAKHPVDYMQERGFLL